MVASTSKSVLIVGGSGIVGSRTAKILRRLHPDLPITIGGRDASKAEAVAKEIGGADTAKIDLGRQDLGLAPGKAFSAIAMFVKDDTLNSLKYAQATGTPYLNVSTGTFEIGPEVALYIHAPESAPILMASHWLGGAGTLSALHFAKEFRSITSIEMAGVLDEQDMGGPAAYSDYEHFLKISPRGLILENGKWLWVDSKNIGRRFKDVDGAFVQGQVYGPFDVLSLAAATDARSVRFDFVFGETASRRRGEPFSTEIVIEMAGELKDGKAARVRYELVHPEGQVPVTALSVAVGIERLLGLAGGPPVLPGLYLPESVIDPAYMVERLKEFGTRIRKV